MIRPTILAQKINNIHNWHRHCVFTNCATTLTGRRELVGSAQYFTPAKEWKGKRAQLKPKAETGS